MRNKVAKTAICVISYITQNYIYKQQRILSFFLVTSFT